MSTDRSKATEEHRSIEDHTEEHGWARTPRVPNNTDTLSCEISLGLFFRVVPRLIRSVGRRQRLHPVLNASHSFTMPVSA